jgi:hypothetical protein
VVSGFFANLGGSAWAAGVSLLALAIALWPLELLFPARAGQRLFRPRWLTDLTFFAGQYLLWIGLAGAIIHGLDAHIDALVPRHLRVGFAAWPVALQAVMVVMLGDLAVYWFHRACHAVPLLWRFHAVHHSAEHLDWLAALVPVRSRRRPRAHAERCRRQSGRVGWNMTEGPALWPGVLPLLMVVGLMVARPTRADPASSPGDVPFEAGQRAFGVGPTLGFWSGMGITAGVGGEAVKGWLTAAYAPCWCLPTTTGPTGRPWSTATTRFRSAPTWQYR